MAHTKQELRVQFAANLKEIMQRFGIDIATLADVLGVTRPAISNWRTASRLPELPVLLAFVLWLRVQSHAHGQREITLEDLLISDV